jgi:hypothetical protein
MSGRCPTCGRRLVLTKTAVLRRHRRPDRRPCPGAGQPARGLARLARQLSKIGRIYES